VTSRVGGVPDAVRDGENGLLVPAGNADAFADAISTLLTDRHRADAMGREGARRAAEEYAAPVVIGGLERLYDQLLSTH
jgi:glycosyltransferase involved in cell wall biosynthesis